MYYPFTHEHQYRQNEQRRMTVIGQGEVLVEPDTMTIQFEVQTENTSLRVAQQENSQIMNQVIQALIGIGIPRENIQTTGFNITPMYDYIDGEQVFRGYQVTNTITVKLTNIEEVGDVIDTAVSNGVNRVSAIRFSVQHPDEFYREALNKALEDARSKARTIANNMQVNLAPIPVKITEKTNEPQPRLMTFAAAESTTPIEPGQISVTAIVEVIFQY